MLFADYLVHYLSAAEEAIYGPPADTCGAAAADTVTQTGSGSGGSGRSNDSGQCAACPPPLAGGEPSVLPARPLHPGGRDVYRMRCYGSASAVVSAPVSRCLQLACTVRGLQGIRIIDGLRAA